MKRFFSLLFLPQEHNNHRALILQPSFIAIFIAIYLLNQSLVKSFTIIKPGVLGYSSEITAKKVFDLTNQERKNQNLFPLHYNSTLSLSASKKANDMFAHNYWAHNSPSGNVPWDFFKEVGYEYSVAGENLAKDFYSPEDVLDAWMRSPTHRANIVNNKYREIGIAVVNGTLNGIQTTLVIQHFGSPLNLKLPDNIVNSTPEEIAFNSPTTTSSLVLSQSTTSAISPLLISKAVGGLMFTIILVVLIIDAYITVKNKTHRLNGSFTGHLSFLAVIFLLLLFSRQGTIF